MIASPFHSGASSRLAGNIILGTFVTLAACGLYVASWGVLTSVPLAMAIIGAGLALQLVPRFVVLAAVVCLALVKRCSLPGPARFLRLGSLSA
jgi:hypothetical protein